MALLYGLGILVVVEAMMAGDVLVVGGRGNFGRWTSETKLRLAKINALRSFLQMSYGGSCCRSCCLRQVVSLAVAIAVVAGFVDVDEVFLPMVPVLLQSTSLQPSKN